MYGKVEDGYELVIKFFELIQGPKQKASYFLQQLFVHLTEAVQRGGVPASSLDEYLTRQFLRGCRDDQLLTKLGLVEGQTVPFQELLRVVRIQEKLKEERESRFGSVKSFATVATDGGLDKVATHVRDLERQFKGFVEKGHRVSNRDSGEASATDSNVTAEIRELRAAVHQLQATGSSSKPVKERSGASTSDKQTRRFRGFCYRCGEDGHPQWKCRAKEPNPVLVQEKLMAKTSAKRSSYHPKATV